jgi:hypothetical protein
VKKKTADLLAHDKTWKLLVWGHLVAITPLVLLNLVSAFTDWLNFTATQTFAITNATFWVTLTALLLSMVSGTIRARRLHEKVMDDIDVAQEQQRITMKRFMESRRVTDAPTPPRSIN